jgi:antitoxin component HigA of HigAB toxin-antitoxin module
VNNDLPNSHTFAAMEKSWSVLTTEDEYEIALTRTIDLFQSAKGSPEGDELAILLPLIAAYEDIHFLFPPVQKKTKAKAVK